MLAGDPLPAHIQAMATERALLANEAAVAAVEDLTALGVCPSQASRYNNQTHMMVGIVTATEAAWGAMLPLRLAEDADPAIRLLAYAIREALEGLSWSYGLVHLPYFDVTLDGDLSLDDAMKVCAARIARVSYGNPGQRGKDVSLGERLLRNKHWSPFDQCAVWATGHDLSISPLCCLPEDMAGGGGWNTGRTRFDSTPTFRFTEVYSQEAAALIA